MKLIVRNGRLLDPDSKTDRSCDIVINDGYVAEITEPRGAESADAEVIDATGRWVLPGLIDLRAHLRDPGEEYKEDLESGARAAVAGGFTRVCMQPDTTPCMDSSDVIRSVIRRAESLGLCRIHPVGASSVGLRGEIMGPVAELKAAGAIAVAGGEKWLGSASLMRRVIEYASDFDVLVMSAPHDESLSPEWQMHEGYMSTRLGLQGIPGVAEEVAVARDIMLAEYAGARVHLSGISTAAGIELIRSAKSRGVRVSADVHPLHFHSTHEALHEFSTSFKIRPPLREASDRAAVIAGLKDETLDAIASHHEPHSVLEKDSSFQGAEFGVPGLQTVLSMALDLWREHNMAELDLIRLLTTNPAKILGLQAESVAPGRVADLTVVDPTSSWILDASTNMSKSSSHPSFGKPLQGRVHQTICQGRVVYHEGADARAS